MAAAIARALWAHALQPQRLQRPAPLIDAHPAVTAARPVRRQPRIDRLQAKVNRHCAARYQRVRLLRRHVAVRQPRSRLHAELQPLVQMSACVQKGNHQ